MTSSFQSTTSGGGWGGPIAAIFTAMIAAVVLGPLLHWLEIALACLGIGAAITAGLVVRRRWREHQALTRGRYVPWLQPPQQQPQQFPGPPAAASRPGRRPASAPAPGRPERRGARRGDAPAARRVNPAAGHLSGRAGEPPGWRAQC